MFTFLRKIRQSLVATGSVRRYLIYAIGEIALVVIGILIALQINNWNEFNKDRQQEKDILHDILLNIERNNNIIYESLSLLKDFDNSSDIVISAIDLDLPYSDTLGRHFFSATRTGGLLFPISSEGYESFKNAGFHIVRSKLLKDGILALFETCYKSIKLRAEWSIITSADSNNFINTKFKQEYGEVLIPNDYNLLKSDRQFYTIIVNTKESQRDFLRKGILNCLGSGKELARLIKKELGEY